MGRIYETPQHQPEPAGPGTAGAAPADNEIVHGKRAITAVTALTEEEIRMVEEKQA
jgi:hypothetical protein